MRGLRRRAPRWRPPREARAGAAALSSVGASLTGWHARGERSGVHLRAGEPRLALFRDRLADRDGRALGRAVAPVAYPLLLLTIDGYALLARRGLIIDNACMRGCRGRYRPRSEGAARGASVVPGARAITRSGRGHSDRLLDRLRIPCPRLYLGSNPSTWAQGWRAI